MGAITSAVQDPEFEAKAKETFQPLRVLAPDAYAAELSAMDQEFRTLWQTTPWLK